MADTFHLLVSGTRHATWAHREFIASALLSAIELGEEGLLHEDVEMRHGKCKYGGVDLIADSLARGWRWGVDAMPAEERGGRILGPLRNQAMCDKQPRADRCVAFPQRGSFGKSGTWDLIHRAADAGIEVIVHSLDVRGGSE